MLNLIEDAYSLKWGSTCRRYEPPLGASTRRSKLEDPEVWFARPHTFEVIMKLQEITQRRYVRFRG
jgi:hypothetical protein